MTKILKYFKPFIGMFLVCLVLLGAQAFGELFLPEYMSKMVNVGFSQSGIEYAVPKTIQKEKLEELTQYFPQEDKAKIESMYSKDSMSETFGNEVVSLNEISKSELIEIESLFITNTKKLFDRNITESEVKQMLIRTISENYTILGLDTEKMQIDYTLEVGKIMLLASGGIAICVIFETFIAAKIAGGIGTLLRKKVFAKVISFSNADFDKFSTASLLTRTTNDIAQIQNMTVMFIRICFYSPILALGGLSKILQTNLGMTWIVGIGIGVIILLLIVVFLFAVPRFKLIQKLTDKINLVVGESLTGLLVIRTFGNQNFEKEKFRKVNRDLADTTLFIGRVMSSLLPIMMFTMNAITVLIIWISAGKINASLMGLGDMMAFIQYAMQIIMSFLMFSMISMFLPRASVSASRIVEILETETTIKDPENPQTFISSKKGEVEFKNVSFKYSGAEDYVIKNISFTAKAGETTAFIGGTGSGKTSIINLIPRFYDTTEGEVLVNGVDVKNIKQTTLRNTIGFVPQKGLLFSGTIQSNIKFGDQNITDEMMKKAAEISQSKEFIDSKTEKFNEPIAQGGNNVSGGQKQRLSIARAIAKNPEIFIFDDSFSALDYKTDVKLRKSLGENLTSSTIIMVGQRIGTIKNAHQIVVIDEGEIVGIGKHKELLKSCDIYRQIALSQLSEKELESEN